MKKSKVVLDFIKISIAEKITFFRNIINLMTNNVLFANPDVPLTDVVPVVDTLETDFTAAKSGAHMLVAKMNQSEKIADDAFRKLAMYVNRMADGDPTVILSSGFHVSKQPEPSKRDTFMAEVGENPCEIALTRKAQPGAKSYVWQYCIGTLPTNGQTWVFAGSSTQAKFTVTDLESGFKCWFRVAAVTSSGMEPWSDPVMKVVP